MKSFEEFRELLSDDIINQLHQAALSATQKKLDELYDNDYEKTVNQPLIYSSYMIIELLEQYHLWLNK